ncbi:MAG: hypothetical protein ACQEQF_11670, partial [Bacillota bacterium]
EQLLEDKEVFLLRNLTRGNGVGFFDIDRYYPDFILWIKGDNKQYITFVDPKGILKLEDVENNKKVQLAEDIKEFDIEFESVINDEVVLNSFIMVDSDYSEVKRQYRKEYDNVREEFRKMNMFFIDDYSVSDLGDSNKIIEKLFTKILNS